MTTKIEASLNEIAAKFLCGEDITAEDVISLIKGVNTPECRNTLQNGVVVMYSRMEDFNVRRNEGITRYSEFASKEEAEQFLSTLKSRDGKWEWGRIIVQGDYVCQTTSDYKGDYERVRYLSGVDLINFLEDTCSMIIEQGNKAELQKFWVGDGEVFGSREAAYESGCHPENVVCVLGADEAKKMVASQNARMQLENYGD